MARGSGLGREVERTVERAAERAAEEAIERRMEGQPPEGEFLEEPTSTGEPDPNSRLSELMSSLPSGDGYFLKLYRELPAGKWEFKLRIDDYAHWTDLETEIANIVRSYAETDPDRWTAGNYRVLTYCTGKPGWRCRPILLSIDPGKSTIARNLQQGGPDNAAEKIKEVAALLAQVKGIMGGSPNPAEMSRMLSETFRAGLEAVPRGDGAAKDKDFVDMIGRLQTIGVIAKPETDKPRSDRAGDFRDIIVLMKELGLVGVPRQENNLLDTIRALKELGLIQSPQPKGEDELFGTIEKLKTLIEVVKPLIVGGEGGFGEKPSLGVELVRILGPRVPDMVARITGTVDKVADVQKLKIERSLGVRPGAPLRSEATPLPAIPYAGAPGAATVGGGPSPSPAEGAPLPPTGEQSLHPVIAEIHEAIESRNTAFHPKLRQLIDIYIGPHMVPALITGQIAKDVFLASLAEQLAHPYFNEPQSLIYFGEFIEAQAKLVQGVEKPPSPSVGVIIGRCVACGEEFEYPEGDGPSGDEVCGVNACQGTIEPVVAQPIASGAATGG